MESVNLNSTGDVKEAARACSAACHNSPAVWREANRSYSAVVHKGIQDIFAAGNIEKMNITISARRHDVADGRETDARNPAVEGIFLPCLDWICSSSRWALTFVVIMKVKLAQGAVVAAYRERLAVE
jgi:hypothetical protein